MRNITAAKREHPEVWRSIEERIRSFPADWIEIEHDPGHATEDTVKQGEEQLRNTELPMISPTSWQKKRRSLWWSTATIGIGILGESRGHQATAGKGYRNPGEWRPS